MKIVPPLLLTTFKIKVHYLCFDLIWALVVFIPITSFLYQILEVIYPDLHSLILTLTWNFEKSYQWIGFNKRKMDHFRPGWSSRAYQIHDYCGLLLRNLGLRLSSVYEYLKSPIGPFICEDIMPKKRCSLWVMYLWATGLEEVYTLWLYMELSSYCITWYSLHSSYHMYCRRLYDCCLVHFIFMRDDWVMFTFWTFHGYRSRLVFCLLFYIFWAYGGRDKLLWIFITYLMTGWLLTCTHTRMYYGFLFFRNSSSSVRLSYCFPYFGGHSEYTTTSTLS